MTDEKKLVFAFWLFSQFLPLSRILKERDVTTLSEQDQGILYAVLGLSDGIFNLLIDVCNIVGREDTDSGIKKNFYYLLVKVKVIVERQFGLNDVSEKFQQLIDNVELSCPDECLFVMNYKLGQIRQQNNPEACRFAARKYDYPYR